MDNMGYITRDYTVWCGVCTIWVQLSEPTKKQMEREIKKQGWRKVKGLWICPVCRA